MSADPYHRNELPVSCMRLRTSGPWVTPSHPGFTKLCSELPMSIERRYVHDAEVSQITLEGRELR